MDEKWIKARVLGSGSYGTVSLAAKIDVSTASASIAAVKSAPYPSSTSLKYEGIILQQLRGFPHIIQCFGEDVSIEKNRLVYNLLLEYAPHGTLLDLISFYSGNMPEYLVARYCYMLLKGLFDVHEQGFVHCDMKPENVLVFPSEDGVAYNLKIADFGLATVSVSQEDEIPTFENRGTMLYSSPESVSWGIRKKSTDIWSLGCIVAEMFSGKTLWSLDHEMTYDLILEIAFKDPNIPENISHMAKDFLKICLEKEEKKRWTASMLLNHPFIVANLAPIFNNGQLRSTTLMNNPFGSTGAPWVSTLGLFSTPIKVEEHATEHPFVVKNLCCH